MSTGPLIVQETHYDPWGVELSGLGYQYGGIKVNPYLYNGKEAQGHLGVNLYDYGARLYDPAIGRWFVSDPMAAHPLQIDKSPYAYGWNNPIRYIDPDGRIVGTLIGGIIGAIGGATDAFLNKKDVFSGAVEGATAGIITGAIVDITVATGGSGLIVIGAAAAGGAIGSATGDIAGQFTQNLRDGDDVKSAASNINYENTGEKAVKGAMTGAAGGAVGAVVGKGLQSVANSSKAIQSTLSKNISETAKTLTQSGASQKTVETAVNKITSAMGAVGRNTANNSAKISGVATSGTEVFSQISQIVNKKEN
jgi:RHS repeat-associated protein